MKIIDLIHGEFSKADVLDLATKMIHIKIRYHEDKIKNSHTEEDIKMREARIRQLQKDLHEFRKEIEQKEGKLSLLSQLQVN